MTTCVRRAVPTECWELLRWVLRADEFGVLPVADAAGNVLERRWPAVRRLAAELFLFGKADGRRAKELLRRWPTEPHPDTNDA